MKELLDINSKRVHFRPINYGLVAQRITRLTTDQKIAGSNPAEIETFSILLFIVKLAKTSCYYSCLCFAILIYSQGREVRGRGGGEVGHEHF